MLRRFDHPPFVVKLHCSTFPSPENGVDSFHGFVLASAKRVAEMAKELF